MGIRNYAENIMTREIRFKGYRVVNFFVVEKYVKGNYYAMHDSNA